MVSTSLAVLGGTTPLMFGSQTDHHESSNCGAEAVRIALRQLFDLVLQLARKANRENATVC
jgi:hypothetical protein